MRNANASENRGGTVWASKASMRIGAILLLMAAAVIILVRTGARATVTPCPASIGCVTTHGYDNSRDNVNGAETTLKASTLTLPAANVNTSADLSGAVYGQPLFVSQMAMDITRNAVLVATEENYIYALDGGTLATVWMKNLNQSGESAVPDADLPNGCPNIQPEVGVTGTPVIDVQNLNSTEQYSMFVVSKHINGTGTILQRLNAIDARTGNLIAQTADMAPLLTNFSSDEQNQRAALALTYDGSNNPLVYIAWASHCDDYASSGSLGYAGRVAVFKLSGSGPASFSLVADFSSTAVDIDDDSYNERGGIWMSGSGPAIDDVSGGSGNVYLSVGNGLWDGVSNFGESVLRLNLSGSSLAVNGSYTPEKWATLNNGSGTPPTCSPAMNLPPPQSGTSLCIPNDFDLGSGGIALARPMGSSYTGPNPEVLAGGKLGVIYALSPSQMGTNYNSGAAVVDTTDPCSEGTGGQAVDCIAAVQLPNPLPTSTADYGVRGSFAFWGGPNSSSAINAMYVAGSQDGPGSQHGQIRAYQMNADGTFDTSPQYGTVDYPRLDSSNRIPYPGSCLVISWNPAGNLSDAILWVLVTANYQTGTQTQAGRAELYAYAAQPNGSHAIVSANSYGGDTTHGPGATKFMAPTSINGYVYVAGQKPNVTCDVVGSANPCKGQVVSWH